MKEGDLTDRIAAARKEATELKEKITALRKEKDDGSLEKIASGLDKEAAYKAVKGWRNLAGHDGKIYSFHWATEPSRRLVSAGQDGNLIVWDGISTHKLFNVSLRSNWVLACAYCPNADFVASGGLDNICSVFHLKEETPSIKDPAVELKGHNGYISTCRFLDTSEILTSSGDGTCVLWDVEKTTQKTTFRGHEKDVLCLDVEPGTKNKTFLSASVSGEVKLWDIRSGNCERTFAEAHDCDINSVVFFPNGSAFATGAEDGACKLFDIRADRELANLAPHGMKDATTQIGCSSVAFSLSGNFLFAGHENGETHAWDVFRGEHIQTIKSHALSVTSVGVSVDGFALCTASWDRKLIIYA